MTGPKQTAEGGLISPVDVLVTVHYDNLDQDAFVRKQVESRIVEYLGQGRSVYNFSTFRKPAPQKQVIQIASRSGDAQLYSDLGTQVEQLTQLLNDHHGSFRPEVELVGVVWWNC